MSIQRAEPIKLTEVQTGPARSHAPAVDLPDRALPSSMGMLLSCVLHLGILVVVGGWLVRQPPRPRPELRTRVAIVDEPVELVSAPDPPPEAREKAAATLERPAASARRPAAAGTPPSRAAPLPRTRAARTGKARTGVERPDRTEGADAGNVRPAPARPEAKAQAEKRAAHVPKVVPDNPEPVAPPDPEASESQATGDQPGRAAAGDEEWQRLTRAEGRPEDTPVSEARWLSDRNQRSDEEQRSLSSVHRAIGSGNTADTTMAPDQAGQKSGALMGQGPKAAGVGGRKPGEGTPTSEELPGAGHGGVVSAPGQSASGQEGRGAARPSGGGPDAAVSAPETGPATPPGLVPLVSSGVVGVSLVDPELPPKDRPAEPVAPRTTPRVTAPAESVETPGPEPVPGPSNAEPIRPKKSFAADFLAPLIAPGPEDTTAQREMNTAGWASMAILPEEVTLGEETILSTRESPLGYWWVGVDDRIRRQWRYPPELSALGIEGTVELGFLVKKNGEIRDVRVLRSAGRSQLDAAAAAAIPARVEPLPPGFRRLPVKLTFRYRAP